MNLGEEWRTGSLLRYVHPDKSGLSMTSAMGRLGYFNARILRIHHGK